MIHRHNRCVGITVFKFGKRQIELWFVPRLEKIEPHFHKHCDSVIIPILGSMVGCIGNKSGKTGWWDLGRRFHIPAYVFHSATTAKSFCLFLNFEKWDTQPTSASIDFVQ